jgi:hypothetical protein
MVCDMYDEEYFI